MKNALATAFLALIKQFGWLMLLFAFSRLIFMFVYSGLIAHTSAGMPEVGAAFVYAIHLDVATACYFLALPFMALTLWLITGRKWIKSFLIIYSGFISLVTGLLLGGELGLYGEWKTKINYKALMYLKQPAEVFNSIATWEFILWLLVVVIFVAFTVEVYRRWFAIQQPSDRRHWWHAPVFVLAVPPFLVLGARGGIQEIPINQSASYYSSHGVLNAAAVNTTFNLYISVFENRKFLDKNPYAFMPGEVAAKIVDRIFHPPSDSTIEIITVRRPNVVVLILESWSADLIQSLGGEPGITPEFALLEKQGVLFTKTFAGGARSEQGMAAIFSGFPPHPYTSITVQPDKYSHLPSWPLEMKNAGYHSSFYFGGQLIYGNIKSYMMFTGFEKIVEMDGFDKKLPRGKLGIHDQYTLDRLMNDLDSEKQPFFASLFTLSSHSPYDQPMDEKLQWGGSERQYINSAYYTDWCLGRFFKEASTKPWYSNTLFVLVADHSHNSYRNHDPKSFEYNRIPMLWLGEVVKPEWRGRKVEKLVSQTDLASTLLRQLGLSDEPFFWSRNVLNSHYEEAAYHVTDEGVLGWKRPDGFFIEDMSFRKIYQEKLPPTQADTIRTEGYAFLQVLFQQYLDF